MESNKKVTREPLKSSWKSYSRWSNPSSRNLSPRKVEGSLEQERVLVTSLAVSLVCMGRCPSRSLVDTSHSEATVQTSKSFGSLRQRGRTFHQATQSMLVMLAKAVFVGGCVDFAIWPLIPSRRSMMWDSDALAKGQDETRWDVSG